MAFKILYVLKKFRAFSDTSSYYFSRIIVLKEAHRPVVYTRKGVKVPMSADHALWQVEHKAW